MNDHRSIRTRPHGAHRPHAGFTLVELIVALGLFALAVSLASSGIVTVLDMNNKTRDLQTVMNNFNYTLEAMTRDIRFGRHYTCGASAPTEPGNNCPSGDDEFAVEFVENGTTKHIAYRLRPGGSQIERCIYPADTGSCTWSPVTSGTVRIEALQFFVVGVGEDGAQPRVTMSIDGEIGAKDEFTTSFSLQSAVTQRDTERIEITGS